MKEKKYLILGISIILISIIGVTFAYFSTSILGDRKKVSVDMAELKIIFTNGDTIEATNVSPEENLDIVKTFSVENKTRYDYEYNIVIEELINTFKTSGYLLYKITSSDGGYNMTEFKDVPKSSTATNTVLAYGINVPAKTIHNYTIEIKYINSEKVNQNNDMGAQLKGKIFISKGFRFLSDAILEDNPTIKTRNDFSITNTENTNGILYKTIDNQFSEDSDMYYFSGNTQNNWLYLKSDPITTCSYENTEVIYYDLSSKKTKVITSEEMCISTNICKFTDEDNLHIFVGLTEESCTKDCGTWLNEKATYRVVSNKTYWRIVKMHHKDVYSKSVEAVYLIYAGDSPYTTEGYITSSKFNNLSNDPMYVGYKYGTSGSLENNLNPSNSSLVLSVMSTWIRKSLPVKTFNFSYFFYDRSISNISNNSYSLNNSFYYGAYDRLKNYNPSFYPYNYSDRKYINDLEHSTIDIETDVGLLSADDVAFAGGVIGVNNTSAWYNTNANGESITNNKSWWTMTPRGYNPISEGSSTLGAFNYSVNGNGAITYNLVTDELALRPVIGVYGNHFAVTGRGTPDNPYVFDRNNSLKLGIQY